jgi:hypothetical protein
MNGRRVTAQSRLAMLVGLALACSGCATVVGGTTQDIFIASEPAGAACKVDRLGANVAVVNPTPGRVNVSRSKETMIVSCTRDGYEQSNEVLVASFTGATVGNIIAGGVVGIIVDAASGANNKYPDRVMVVMTPAAFADDAARDAHFAGIRSRLEQGADAEIKLIQSRCSSTNREICTIEVKQLTDARDKALADLDRKRLATKVGVGASVVASSPPPAAVASAPVAAVPVASAPAAATSTAVAAAAPQATPSVPDSFEGKWVGTVGDWNVDIDIRGNAGTFTAQCPRLQIPANVAFSLAADGTFLLNFRALGAAATGPERRDVSGRLPQVSISTNATCLGGTATLRKQ